MLTCVTDLAFGDAGKGKIVDHLANDYDILVRFNGGPNAGHTVVINEEKKSLHNLPSGLFVDNPQVQLFYVPGWLSTLFLFLKK